MHITTPKCCALGAALLLTTAIPPPVDARDASQECQGGLPSLALLEGNGYAVNGYLADCGNGTARKALVIPDGAAATGDGVTCSLGGQPFDLTSDAVVANGIRADRGDTVQCNDGASFKLRAGGAAPLPGGTSCQVSDETLFGNFTLIGQEEVEVTVEAMLVDCGGSGSALIVPRGATTTVDPIVKGVQLRCPVDRFQIRNQATGQSVGGQLVVVADDQISDCEAQLKGRDRQTALFDLTLHEPVECGDGSKCVFFTSTRHRAFFGVPEGGLAFADAECNVLADAAGLPGTYMAWLSDDTGSPSTRFTQASVPYQLVDGTQIADDWADLTDGSLDSAIELTESGDPPSPAQRVWTGTGIDGTLQAPNCANWTVGLNSSFTTFGLIPVRTASWTADLNGSLLGCRPSLPFYCFQQ